MNSGALTTLLEEGLRRGASDLHLSAALQPLLRIDGQLLPTESNIIFQNEQLKDLLYALMSLSQRQQYETHLSCDFSFELPEQARFRINIFEQYRGHAAAIRFIPWAIPTLSALNMPSLFAELSLKQRGLILITGATGSGKSTTLAAMIDHRNQHTQDHILSIEDPIEFVHTPNNSLIHQRAIGMHCPSFDEALRMALREDPDLIMVGEMRDLETIRLALTAAETGHLVLATLHTQSAIKTIDRIVDAFPAAEKETVRIALSESLEAVISQTLVKRHNAAGHASGRIAAHEIMLATPAIRHLIRENKTAQMLSVIQTSRNKHMQTLEQHLNELLSQGHINKEEVQKLLQ